MIPDCDGICGKDLRDSLVAAGIDGTVGPWPNHLFVVRWYEPLDWVCPHGVRWNAEPTPAQIRRWAERARQGVA